MFALQQHNEPDSLFKRIDILGLPITIRFNSNQTHRTYFGATITIGIITILLIQLVEVFQDTNNYKNFNYIFQENIVEVPKRYDIKPNTFQFAFGLDKNLKHYIDEEVYKVEAILSETKKVFNNATQVFEFVTNDTSFKPIPCTPNHFQIKGAIDYFLKLPYKDLYCFPLDMELNLEGQYAAEIYRRIRFRFKYCSGIQCKPESYVKEKLTNMSLKIYYVNYAVKVTNHEQPFQPIGMNTFWQNSYNIMKNVNIYFRNSFFESQEGLITQESTTYHNLIYGLDREQLVTQFDNIMFEVYLQLEKNKESEYIRKYSKLQEGVSQVGGLFNILFSLGCLISYPLSQLNFQQKLLNSIFSFSKGESLNHKRARLISQEQSNSDKLEQQKMENNDNTKNESKLDINNNLNLIKNQSDLLASINSNFRLIRGNSCFSPTNSFHQKRIQTGDIQKSNGDTPLEHSALFSLQEEQTEIPKKAQEIKEAIPDSPKIQIRKLQNKKQTQQQTIFSFKQIKLKFTDVFKGLLSSVCFFKNFLTSPNTQMVNAALEQLNNYLDIYTIITKIQEFDKLKHLLLNKDQMKLFDFIPQSVFYENDFNQEVDLQTQAFRRQSTQAVIKNYTKKAPAEKAIEAQEAYIKIFRQQNASKISKIDKKIISLLDPEISKLFEQGNIKNTIIQPRKSLF